MLRLLALLSCSFMLNTTAFGSPETSSSPSSINFEEAIKKDQFNISVSSSDLESMNKAKVLLIACADFRLRDETTFLMEKELGLLDNYDEIVLPGAALALANAAAPHWSKTVEDCIKILGDLHDITDVIFLDHRNCGAFKIIKGEKSIASKEAETATHKDVFAEIRRKMKEKFPKLNVHTMLVGLDGVVENFKEETSVTPQK